MSHCDIADRLMTAIHASHMQTHDRDKITVTLIFPVVHVFLV